MIKLTNEELIKHEKEIKDFPSILNKVEKMINVTSCSLCGQHFNKSDPDLEIRKSRHEEKHTRGKNFKSRSYGGGNNIIGEVKWL